ncbi:MAG TPA: GNAT family N-acetyltransferase [Pyrinomonadaceae bacterium]
MSELRAAGVSFREAGIADCPAVAKVHVQSWKESFAGIVPQTFLDKMSVEKRAKAFEKRFPDPLYRMYVAEASGRGLVGFADFGEARENIDAYDGELYAVYLLPEFQRKGIGKRLFNLGVEFLRASGKSSMYLFALEVSPYRSFYEKMGGKIIGSKQIEIEGAIYDELIYGWKHLS